MRDIHLVLIVHYKNDEGREVSAIVPHQLGDFLDSPNAEQVDKLINNIYELKSYCNEIYTDDYDETLEHYLTDYAKNVYKKSDVLSGISLTLPNQYGLNAMEYCINKQLTVVGILEI